jgi:hypothetical protein
MPTCFSEQGGSQGRGGVPASQMTEKSHDPLDQKEKTAAVPGRVFAAHAGGASRRTGYMAAGDLFEAAEVHDLNEVRIARRAAVDRGNDDTDKGEAG